MDRVLRDAGQDIGQPGLRIDVVHFGGDNDAVHRGGALSTAIGAGEQPRLSTQGHCPFILPMSGKSWKSIIDGTRILAAKLASGAWSNERRADFLRFWGRPVSSFPSSTGCSIPWSALE